MKLSIVEVFAQETSTQANSFTVFLSIKCMYELLKCKEEQKKKNYFFSVRILCCIYTSECNIYESLQPFRQMHCFKTFFAFSSRPKQFGPQGPSFDIYIYIYIYWVGPQRGAHGEETHPSLVGLQFSSLIHEGFLLYKLFKKPSHNRCGT